MASSDNRNDMLLQTFEWHTAIAPDKSHYQLIRRFLPRLAEIGITGIWLPPGCKANNPQGNGYDIYDLWDLGEFDQKGSRGTKWGDRAELDELIQTAQELRVDVVWDAVLNHKQAGDRTDDEIWAVEVDPRGERPVASIAVFENSCSPAKDRRFEICSPKKIEAWLRYDFPGRAAEGMKYSAMTWRAEHFNGTDWDQSRNRNAIYKLIDNPSMHPSYQQPPLRPAVDPTAVRSRLQKLRRRFSSQTAKRHLQLQPPAPPRRRPGKGWAEDVDDENGNNDYLMFSNIDHSHPEVRRDMFDWGRWMVGEIGVQGFRLDAAQHFSYNFTREWIAHADGVALEKYKKRAFIVGEIWTGDVRRILKWLDAVQSPSTRIYAYDSPLLYNFSRISEDVRTRSKNTDLRTILRESLALHRPEAAVTLVANHDTQEGQTCATPVRMSLKPLFYAFILLRKEGYPCIFWGDLFGTGGPHAEPPACLVPDPCSKNSQHSLLPNLILCRKLFAHGDQIDYWDQASCIGWSRGGIEGEDGLAVVLNVGVRTVLKTMAIGRPGEIWVDVLGQVKGQIAIDSRGCGNFPCRSESVSVFVKQADENTAMFPVDFDVHIFA